jgi:hypothetical protein
MDAAVFNGSPSYAALLTMPADDMRSRGTGRVQGGAAHSARREGTMGTMNAAEVVTVQHLVNRYGHVLAVDDICD